MIITLLVYAIIAGIHLFKFLKPADEHTNSTSAEQPNIAFSNTFYSKWLLYAPAGFLKLPLEEIIPDG